MTDGQVTTPTASMTKQEIIGRMADLQAQLSNLQVQLEMVQEENDKPEPSEETRARARELNPIDDIFFSKMGESPEVCEEIISTILQFPVRVLRVVPQYSIVNLQNRSVRLDAFADVERKFQVEAELAVDCPVGKKGAKVNIEVQKDDNDDHQKRVLYNAAAVMLNSTPKGTKKFSNVPDVIVIFISKFDLFRKGRMLYKVNRVLDGIGDIVHNGMWEYYANAAVADRSTEEMSAIADLMEIFTVSEKYDYNQFPKTSERKNQFKNTEEGVRAMSDGLQAWVDKERQEQARETMATSIANVMESLDVSVDRAMDVLRIPESERETYEALMQARV